MRTIHSKIVGVTKTNRDGSNRQEIIREQVSAGDFLLLERDFDNPYDSNAIRVRLDSGSIDDDQQIGFLTEKLAAELAPLMDAGQEINCRAIEITGFDQDVLGVNIELEILTPEETRVKNARTQRTPQTRPVPPPPTRPAAKPVKQKPQVMVIKSDKNFTALIIWFALLGLFGGHRFYVGRGSWLYSLTVGYFLIGYCIDFLQIVTGTFKDNHGYMIKP